MGSRGCDVAVAKGWDRDPTRCCKEGCDRHRAPIQPDGTIPLECQWHIDERNRRIMDLTDRRKRRAKVPPARFETPRPVAPATYDDPCPKCGAPNARTDHAKTGC